MKFPSGNLCDFPDGNQFFLLLSEILQDIPDEVFYLFISVAAAGYTYII